MSVWNKLFKQLRMTSQRRDHKAKLLLEVLEDRAVPATLFVNVNGGSDANPGTQAAPFKSIEAAVQKAKQFAIGQINPQQDNNTIEVASGTYTNTGTATDAASVGFPAVVGVIDQQLTITGGFDAGFTTASGQSIIDGGSAIRGISVVATSRPTGINLSNFIIQNGLATSQPAITGNIDGFGGGMIINLGATPTGNPTDTLSNVTFTNNNAQGGTNTSGSTNFGSGGEGAGGAIAAFFANNITLNNVSFNGNNARGGNGPNRGGSGLGGALYGGNGAVYNGSNLTFSNNMAIGATATTGTGVVNGNQFAEGFGGAICLLNQGTSGTFTSITATSNVAQGGNAGSAVGQLAGDARGGAVFAENANVSITNSTLSNNSAFGGTAHDGADASAGGAIYTTAFTNDVTVSLNQVSLLGNTVNGPNVTGTSAPALGGAIGGDTANAKNQTINVTNSVIAGNTVSSPQTATINSGGGAIWTDNVTVNLQHNTIADNTIQRANMTGSAILIFHGTDNLAFNIIANETLAVPAIASIQGGAVNLTGKNLFANIASPGLTAQANLVSVADAKFTNSATRDYTLLTGSPAIDAATGSGLKVDRLGLLRVGTPDLGAFEFGGVAPSSNSSKLGAYRSSDGSWSLDSDGTFGFGPNDQVFFKFSPGGVIGVAGDWTGSGSANIGDFSNGTWHLDLNGNGKLDAGETFTFGQAGDQPVVGNWDGNASGRFELGVFRTASDGITGQFILDTNNNRVMDSGDANFTFGRGSDHIIVGDWNGNGITKVGVYRDAVTFIAADAGNIVFTLDTNNNHAFDAGVDSTFVFGLITDKVVIGDWTGDGTSKVGVYRDGSSAPAGNPLNAPGTALFSLDSGALMFNAQSQVFLFGLTSDQFVSGKWKKTPPLVASV